MPPKKKVKSLTEVVHAENKQAENKHHSTTCNPLPSDNESSGSQGQLLSSIASTARKKKAVKDNSKNPQTSGVKPIDDRVHPKNKGKDVVSQSGAGTKGMIHTSSKVRESNIPKNFVPLTTCADELIKETRLAHSRKMLESLIQSGFGSKQPILPENNLTAKCSIGMNDTSTRMIPIATRSKEMTATSSKVSVNNTPRSSLPSSKVRECNITKMPVSFANCDQGFIKDASLAPSKKVFETLAQNSLGSKQPTLSSSVPKESISHGYSIANTMHNEVDRREDDIAKTSSKQLDSCRRMVPTSTGLKGMSGTSSKVRETNITKTSTPFANCNQGFMKDARLASSKNVLETLAQNRFGSKQPTLSSPVPKESISHGYSIANTRMIPTSTRLKAMSDTSSKLRESNITKISAPIANCDQEFMKDACLAEITRKQLDSYTRMISTSIGLKGMSDMHNEVDRREDDIAEITRKQLDSCTRMIPTSVGLKGMGDTSSKVRESNTTKRSAPIANCDQGFNEDACLGQLKNASLCTSTQNRVDIMRLISTSSEHDVDMSRNSIHTSTDSQGPSRESLKAPSSEKLSYSCTKSSTGTKRMTLSQAYTKSNALINSNPTTMDDPPYSVSFNADPSTIFCEDSIHRWENNIPTTSINNAMGDFGGEVPIIPSSLEVEEPTVPSPHVDHETATCSQPGVESTSNTGITNPTIERESSNVEIEVCLGNDDSDERNPNVEHIPSTSNHHHTRSNSQAYDTQFEEHEFANNISEASYRRKGRGWTGYRTMKPPLGKSKHDCVTLQNEPVHKECTTLSNFLGLKARDTDAFPLHLKWGNFQDRSFNGVWEDVMKLFNFTSYETKMKPNMFHVRQWCLRKVKTGVQTHRSRLKRHLKKRSPEQLLVSPESRVSQDQWEKLLDYWGKEESIAEALRNANNRAHIRPTYTLGRKSIRQKQFEMMLAGRDPTFLTTYVVSHTNKKGQCPDEYTRKVVEDIQTEAKRRNVENSKNPVDYMPVTDHVFGPHHGGYERGYGSGPTRQMLKQAASMEIAHKTYEDIEKEAKFYAEALANAELALERLRNQDVGCSRRPGFSSEEEDDYEDDQN